MNFGDLMLAALLMALVVAFTKAGIDGLRGRKLWIPSEATASDQELDDIPERHRKAAGVFFLMFALVFLAGAVALAWRYFFATAA